MRRASPSRRVWLGVLVLLAVAGALAASAFAARPRQGGGGSGDRYVALGDSYSSGVGTGSYTLDSSCKRSVYAYPYLLAQQRANTHSTSSPARVQRRPTCSRARSARDGSTTIVTVTIGGNDIGFADLIYSARSPTVGRARQHPRRASRARSARLDNVYATIRGPPPRSEDRRARLPARILRAQLLRQLRGQRDRGDEGEPVRRRTRPDDRSPRGRRRRHLQERDRPLPRPRGLLLDPG